jgi:hypothetical protein
MPASISVVAVTPAMVSEHVTVSVQLDPDPVVEVMHAMPLSPTPASVGGGGNVWS